MKQGANTYVNPFTATAMLDFAQKREAKGVVLLAASSALAKMTLRLCQKNHIAVVSVVRRAEQAKDLRDNFAAEHVLVEGSP